MLQWRGDGSTGWSYAWRIPLWARVHDGEFAARQLALQLGNKTFPNLFDKCGPFQVDGNFGATAGIVEMLIQSHRIDPASGDTIIELLPALPTCWPDGMATGLRARSGFTVDLSWGGGRLISAWVHHSNGGECVIRSGGAAIAITVPPGGSVTVNAELKASN